MKASTSSLTPTLTHVCTRVSVRTQVCPGSRGSHGMRRHEGVDREHGSSVGLWWRRRSRLENIATRRLIHGCRTHFACSAGGLVIGAGRRRSASPVVHADRRACTTVAYARVSMCAAREQRYRYTLSHSPAGIPRGRGAFSILQRSAECRTRAFWRATVMLGGLREWHVRVGPGAHDRRRLGRHPGSSS